MKVEKNKRLLLVDDDDDIRESMTDLLRTEGYEVSTARHGLDALTQLREGLVPSLILLDLMMPKMNGWQFLEAQGAEPGLAELPVVLVSADPAVLTKEVPLQVKGRLTKPFDVEALLTMIDRCAA